MENESTNIDSILGAAWLRFSELDTALAARAKLNRRLRLWIAAAGLFITVFTIFSKAFTTDTGVVGLSAKVIPVLVPVILAGLAAFSQLFNSSGDWKIARSAADEIQKEIYLYRTVLRRDRSRRSYLEKRIMEILRHAYQSMGGQLTLTPYVGRLPSNYDPNDPMSDPGFNDLTGDEYFKYRVKNQLKWHKGQINKYQVQRFRLQVLVVCACVLISVLVVMGGVFSLGVELLASLAAALLTWQGVQNIDQTLKEQSKIVLELMMLHDHWLTLAPEERTEVEFLRMVRGCEEVLRAQNREYAKSMQEALREDNLEKEASLIDQVIRESAASAERTKKAMRDSIVHNATEFLQDTEHDIEETFTAAIGSLAEEASSELVQQELDAMTRAHPADMENPLGQETSLTAASANMAEELAQTEVGKDTPKEELNAILVRYPKTSEVKG